MNNHFKIIVPVYNAEKYIGKCIESMQNQSYINWEAIIIDDASTDDTWAEIYRQTLNDDHNDDHFFIKRNEKNKQALYNFFNGIKIVKPNNKDIIVSLDGDDWFSDNDVLWYLNEEYQDKDIWFTYGQYKTASNNAIGCCRPPDDNDNFREQSWRFSHPKTFVYGLWNKLNEKDFQLENGEFVPSPAWDHIITFPLLEMATRKHIKCIDRVLYVYNDLNPINECKKNIEFQEEMAIYGRTKIKKYKPLDKIK